ncbi:MAG: PEP-CTERM sorting domain-containing protein, partial [Opitutales bacterium]|nr:PEP-CTERM sorting domain-containing protein [Opitutales bacterium]
LSLAKNSDLIGSILSSDFTFANIVADTSYILFSFEDGSMNSYLQAIVDSEDNGKYKYIDKASGKYYFAKFAAEDATGEFSVMFSVPEPSTWAAIFGALALAFAIYRRRK